jgi:hypothetical protein
VSVQVSVSGGVVLLVHASAYDQKPVRCSVQVYVTPFATHVAERPLEVNVQEQLAFVVVKLPPVLAPAVAAEKAATAETTTTRSTPRNHRSIELPFPSR